MTGLESHMESELAHEAHRKDEALEQARQAFEKPAKAHRETKAEREMEELMHLRQ